MRRGTDRLVALCAALCVICTIVTVLVVAPTVLDTSSRTNDAEQTSRANRGLIAQVDRESDTRERQFCGLVLGVHRDRVKRLRNTLAYFKTPAGQESTALNLYIKRISLPQLEREIAKERERLPRVCLK